MSLITWEVPVAFIVVVALLLLILVDTKVRWQQKLALIVTVPLFSIAVWYSLSSYLGWTTTEKVPQKAFVMWGVVTEPNSSTDDPGAIYLWLIDPQLAQAESSMLGYDPNPGEPRAYHLPYSRELHEKVEGALTIIKNGGQVVLELQKQGEGEGNGEGEGEEGEGEAGEGNLNRRSQRGGGGYRYWVDTEDIMLYELPPTQPQPKNTN